MIKDTNFYPTPQSDIIIIILDKCINIRSLIIENTL